jgi:citrate synthase
VLRTGVSMLASFDPELPNHSHAANMRKAIRIIARMNTLATSAWRIAHDQDAFLHRPGVNYAARFLSNLTGKEPEDWQIEAFTTVLILYAEHEFNASTFSARVTASTMADIYAAATSALGTLKGPLHGGANEAAMKMLKEIGSADRAEEWVKERLARKEKIMGFGHRVYKKGDSRVPAVRRLTRELGQRLGREWWADICHKLEEVMTREKGLCANLDLYAAPVMDMLGIPAELDISVFAMARSSGWCAHVIEQHDHNRLIRPRCLYAGAGLRRYPVSTAPEGAAYPGTQTRRPEEDLVESEARRKGQTAAERNAGTQ